jgi:hypothetical protein
MTKKPQKQEQPEIDPDKWAQFERTLKRALDMPHKPHKPTKRGKKPKKHG